MKKIGMFLALVGVVMFAFAGSVMALGETTGSVDVDATVDEYAHVIITTLSPLVETEVSGTQVTATGSVGFTVETNCNVTITCDDDDADGELLVSSTTEAPGDSFEMAIDVGNGTNTVGQNFDKGADPTVYTAALSASFGISAHAAATDYTGNLVVTVTAQ